MQRAPRIPELTLCSRFIRQAVAEGVVYAVVGSRGLADVASPHWRSVRTTLLWTAHGEAERWAPVLAENPRVVGYSLAELAGEVLPALAAARHLIGVDWCADPIEPEMTPAELLERLQHKALDCFLEGLRAARTLWIVEDAGGPAVVGSGVRPDDVVLPLFNRREDAESCLAFDETEGLVRAIDLDSFLTVTAPWLAEQGWRVSPGTWVGAGAPELTASELAARLMAGRVAA
jgi:hypothetical protein